MCHCFFQDRLETKICKSIVFVQLCNWDLQQTYCRQTSTISHILSAADQQQACRYSLNLQVACSSSVQSVNKPAAGLWQVCRFGRGMAIIVKHQSTNRLFWSSCHISTILIMSCMIGCQYWWQIQLFFRISNQICLSNIWWYTVDVKCYILLFSMWNYKVYII